MTEPKVITANTTLGGARSTSATRPKTSRQRRKMVEGRAEQAGVEIWKSPDGERAAAVINQSGVPTQQILQGGAWPDPSVKPLMDALVTWTHSVGGRGRAGGRRGDLYERDLFVVPDHPYEQMKAAYNAVDDDVVGSFLSSSEALAFSNIVIECDDPDEQDIWQQIHDDLDVDARMREIWRELNITGQVVVASWFGPKSYKVRGKSDTGVKRKKTFNNLTVPLGITMLDPLRTIAMGNFMFNSETLCYIADPTEQDVFDSWLLGDDASGADPIIKRLIIGKYEPDFRDRKEVGNLGIDANRLYVLNPQYVWRHTLTRPQYARYAPIPMVRIFELLDLKRQLRAADRSALIGVAQFIVLITKGTDEHPASQFEIGYLQAQASTMGSSPVLIGDHRLKVEIITPPTEHIIDQDRWSTLDIRISGSLYGMFITTHAGKDDSLKLARVVARGLESKRSMQRMAVMKNIFAPTFALNDAFTVLPRMVFHPKRISLDFDPSLATYLLDLRDRGDLSRASILSEVDYDEPSEAAKRIIEKEKYDDIFQPQMGIVASPKSTAPTPGAPRPGAANDPKSAGRAKGGNSGHGGNGSQTTGGGQAPRSGAPKDGPGAGTSGTRSRPKQDKHGQTAEEEASFEERLAFLQTELVALQEEHYAEV